MSRWRRIYEWLIAGKPRGFWQERDVMSASRRCSRCGIDWPDDWAAYGKCPGCEQATERILDALPLGTAEALSRRNHYAFDAFCARRDDARVAELEQIPTAERPSD